VRDFLSHLKASEKDLTRPIIAQGDVTYQLLRNYSDEGKDFNELLLWCDNQILALLQVPPIAMGFPDMSGRSNSVEQNAALSTRVKSFHEILEDTITYELFPHMGFDKLIFEFGALDNKHMKSNMEIVKIMKDSGFSDDAIQEWLTSENILFSTPQLFSSESEPAVASTREKKGVDEPNAELDEISTRDDQLVKNSKDNYEYEPAEQWKEY
jgi:hypothetical protein